MIVRPISLQQAREFVKQHPHAPMLPSSAFRRPYCLAAFEGTRFIGLAIWGWGVNPRATPIKMFGTGSPRDYLELNRFFCIDGLPKNTPSQFLAICHRILKKHLPNLKFLQTYAAGFQGMIGTIYQAAGYDYYGKLKVSFYWIPEKGLVHNVALWHRFGKYGERREFLEKVFPNLRELKGYNYCYIYFLRDKEELMKKARFKLLPYPTKDDLKIWDDLGNEIPPEVAKHIPILNLKMAGGKIKKTDSS